ncbi:MAG: hypothetical protein DME41_08730 [Verrucomicrobia bacterium]|nr:MAG: hypothetical protein DME41_08730 [Verrucomicrobiota bacterium]
MGETQTIISRLQNGTRFTGYGRPVAWIAADIVRIENGRLAEHWDVLQIRPRKDLQWVPVRHKETAAFAAGAGYGRPVAWIAADIVRIEDGRLAEHWDVLQDEATKAESKSGLPMFGDHFTG